ncbi:DUF3826 domain-containing protein [Pedobacter sp. SYSU D00535]|uniref:DUF3826 domain-containing protein n=1 Tax=Pedobacter sp. SYSU D00535 TaxID=2810308 RepID=UPI001A971448|nr:DUF3826 domain-containing protein [Pedobacter sp. SYSU D00535]
MKTKFTRPTLALLALLLATTAQAQETPFEEVAKTRADKIVSVLDVYIKDKTTRIRDHIANQYIALHKLHDVRDKKIESARKNTDSTQQLETIKRESEIAIADLHKTFLTKLSREIDREQVARVKDGMTYNVVPITFSNYLLMMPYLNQKQQNQIMDFLVEAREYAMDGGSSEEKHRWFGKYKGKITNYLAAEGFDLKKESNNWAIRRNTKGEAFEIVQSNRIIKALTFDNEAKKESTRNLIAHQYQQIQELSNARDSQMIEIRKRILNKEEADIAEAEIWGRYKKKLDDQRDLFVHTLFKFLNSDQVEIVKNEMTGHELKKEYSKFLDLLPEMTELQKKKVYEYMLQARDNAMNVVTSKDREQWFAKYRGRANNYLAGQNYDLRKATEELEKRTGSTSN